MPSHYNYSNPLAPNFTHRGKGGAPVTPPAAPPPVEQTVNRGIQYPEGQQPPMGAPLGAPVNWAPSPNMYQGMAQGMAQNIPQQMPYNLMANRFTPMAYGGGLYNLLRALYARPGQIVF